MPRPTFEFNQQIPLSQIGTMVSAVGFLKKGKNISAAMSFAQLEGGTGAERVQILARSEINEDARIALRAIHPNSAVSIQGVLDWKYEAKNQLWCKLNLMLGRRE